MRRHIEKSEQIYQRRVIHIFQTPYHKLKATMYFFFLRNFRQPFSESDKVSTNYFVLKRIW